MLSLLETSAEKLSQCRPTKIRAFLKAYHFLGQSMISETVNCVQYSFLV